MKISFLSSVRKPLASASLIKDVSVASSLHTALEKISPFPESGYLYPPEAALSSYNLKPLIYKWPSCAE